MFSSRKKVVRYLLCGVVFFGLGMNVRVAKAANLFFTNSLGGDFTNKTLWMTGVVPVLADTANFTNNTARQISWTINATNANAFFNPTLSGIAYTQAIGSSTWYVTNQYIVAQNGTSTSIVTMTSGTLVVTNAGGTASMIIGQSGDGTFNLNGGTVIVDHVYVTNANASSLEIDGGTLTIKDDSIFGTNARGSSARESLRVAISSANNSTLNIIGGTTFMFTNLVVGDNSGSTGFVNVIGSSTIVSNRGQFYVGDNSGGNTLTISNGAKVWVNREIFIGNGVGANSNTILITDSGTAVTNGQEISANRSFNQLLISNGAVYSTVQLIWGNNAAGTNNLVDVSTGARFQAGSSSHVGNSGISNMLMVRDAGTLVEYKTFMMMGNNASGRFNQIIITNGGSISGATTVVGNSGGDGNKITVTGTGSSWTNNADMFIGIDASSNTILINQGAAMYGDRVVISSNSATVNNMLVISNAGSIFRATSAIVGSNALGNGTSGVILITDRGTLEANSITNGLFGTGNITNINGVFQFTTAAPSIMTNAGGTIFLTNGVISYRDVANAPVLITNNVSRISMFGSNTFMLNNSTNAILSSYTFTNGFGATNFAHLELVNGNTRWQATNTLIGATGTMIVSNTAASTFGTITNAGTIMIAGDGTTLTNEGNLILIGNGAGSEGALVNLVGTNTVSGPILLGGNSTIGSDDGKLILKGTLTNNTSLVIVTNAGTSTVEIDSLISGTGGIVHSGNGTLSLASSNSFSGNITNTSGTISIDQTYAISGLTGSTVLNGGTLLFNVSATNTTAGVILNGGTIQETDTNLSLGALTVSANSSIQLGSGGGLGRIRFATGTNTVGSGAKLTIYGWSWNSALSGGSDDLIFFTSTTFETASFLNNVTFFGTGGGARILTSGELVPITPEPSSIWCGTMLIALGLKQLRKRLSKTCAP